jgi:hypothetical protein
MRSVSYIKSRRLALLRTSWLLKLNENNFSLYFDDILTINWQSCKHVMQICKQFFLLRIIIPMTIFVSLSRNVLILLGSFENLNLFLIWDGVISHFLGQHLGLSRPWAPGPVWILWRIVKPLALAENSAPISVLCSLRSVCSTKCAAINNTKENKLWLLVWAGWA